MNIPSDILLAIRVARSGYGKTYGYVADAVLSDPARIMQMSVKSFAKLASVSEPTVIRFCREAGCLGFKDFKLRVAQSLVMEEKFERPQSAPDWTHKSPYEEFYKTVEKTIQRTLDPVVKERIDSAAEVILASNLVMVYGLGGSSAMMAQEAQNRLFRLGIRTIAHADSYMQRMTAATLTKNDTVLVISSSGQPRSLIDSIEAARHYGATCIAIAPTASLVAAISDVVIPIELDPDILYFQPNPVRYAQLFVIDCLAERLALRLGDKAKASLRRVSAILSPLQGFLPYQPIGD